MSIVRLLATVVVLLLVAPVLVVLAWVFLLFVAGVLGTARQRLRKTFLCPWRRRVVTADFVVLAGAEHPADVTRCTAFEDPARITCTKPCRELAEVRSEVSRGLFPRWSLIADGTAMADAGGRHDPPGDPAVLPTAPLAQVEPCGFYPWRRPPTRSTDAGMLG